MPAAAGGRWDRRDGELAVSREHRGRLPRMGGRSGMFVRPSLMRRMPSMAFRGPKVWLWRWRRNPLKRRADAVEAWVVLGAWLVTVLAGVLAGLTAPRSVEDGLARERVEWRQVAARLTEKAPGTASDHPATSSGD